eukprot:m.296883 g.296883  ORF g.296883 m.296883 type:complete len:342 (+) comp13480_c0_seq1:227-1252(+)
MADSSPTSAALVQADVGVGGVDPADKHHVVAALLIVLSPVLFMNLGSVLVRFWQPGPISHAFLHLFAGGILLASVATELVPLLQQPHASSMAILTGMALSLAVAFALDGELPNPLGACTGAAGTAKSQAMPADVFQLKTLASGNSSDGIDKPDTLEEGNDDEIEDISLHDNDYLVPLTDDHPHKPQPQLPYTMIAAVGCDALSDGLLIGLSSALGLRQGILLAFGLSVEMGFVGIALTCQLLRNRLAHLKASLLVFGLTLLMVAGAGAGAALMQSISEDSFGFVMAMSFATTSLLNLAVRELILEGSEELEDLDSKLAKICLTSSLFLGFAFVLILGNSTA